MNAHEDGPAEIAGIRFADSPFWNFALAVYGEPGIAPLCLHLQDTHGAEVNLLLFCLWVDATGRRLENPAEVDAALTPWRERVIGPVRAARRALKEADRPHAAALHDRLAEDELAAERIAQDIVLDTARLSATGGATGAARSYLSGLDLSGRTLEATVAQLRTAALTCAR